MTMKVIDNECCLCIVVVIMSEMKRVTGADNVTTISSDIYISLYIGVLSCGYVVLEANEMQCKLACRIIPSLPLLGAPKEYSGGRGRAINTLW